MELTSPPFFSVILPTYNRVHRIEKAVNSVLTQNFENFELIIVDDASTDGTKEFVLALTDPRIVYIQNEENIERSASRNKGIATAKGDYICFLDSDDYHLMDHLEKLHERIVKEDNSQGFFFTNAFNESEHGERSDRLCPSIADSSSLYAYFLNYTVNPQRWAVSRSVMEQCKFDPEINVAEDMDLSLRIVEKGFPVYQLEERTTVYVAASDSFTHGDSRKSEKELASFKMIFAKEELKSVLPSKEKNRLLSMCYFHLSQIAFVKGNRWSVYRDSFRSFFLFPAGYNGRTNKIILVSAIYMIPIIGSIFRMLYRKVMK